MTGQAQKLHVQDRPARLSLGLLGSFTLAGAEGHPIAVASKRNRALLAILALSPGLQSTRERLAGLLWSDRSEDQARSSLRQSVAVLRRELSEGRADAIRTQDDRIALDPGAFAIDSLDLLACAGQTDLESLRTAARLCRGSLLADTVIRDAAFEDWLTAERARLQAAAIRVFDRLVPLETGEARIEAAQKLLSLDNLRESSHRLLMRAYAEQGEKALALRQYDFCRKLLQDELGVDPARETQDLRRQIAEGGTAKAPAAAPTAEAPSSPAERKLSIAVLPFANLGGDPEQQYLADGLAEDLTTDLSRMPGLFVIAAQSMLRYRGTAVDPLKTARELGVSYIAHGSMRKLAALLRINVQLIDARSGAVTWAHRIDQDSLLIYELQSDIAAAIVRAVLGPLPAALQAGRYRSPSLEAFDLCMRGRNELRHSDEAGLRARGLFERAIELDPNYSEAYRWLAETDTLAWLFHNEPEHPLRERALANARRAVETDPSDAAAHGTLGWVLLYERKWEESARAFQTALSLNQNDAEAWINLSELRVMEGKPQEGVACANRALQLNPHAYAFYYWALGSAQFAAADYEAAVRTLRREETYRTQSRRILAASLAMLGRLDEARNEAQLFMAAHPHFTIDRWVETQPFRDIAMRDRFVEGYRKAGLPGRESDNRGTSDDKPSIAVLPFANLSGDPAQAYFAEGIAEDIIAELGRSTSLTVIGRSSSSRFRGRSTDARSVGQELGVRYLLDGSVRRGGSQLRVGVQLVDAGSGRQLWSERFDRKMEELFDLQDEIVRSVVMTCEHRIIDREFEAHRNKPRHNWAAYEYVLQARYFLRGYDSAPQAEEPAKRAIEIDPGNSQAHAQLAWVSMNKFWTTGDRKHIGTAYDFARAALERDDMEPLAHSAMSLVAVFKSDGGKALMHAERAVALNPNDVIAVNERSQVLVYLGRHSESLEGLDSILKRDPFPPQWYWETRGMVLFQLRRYSESVDAFRQILNQHPWERAHVIAALAHDGRMAEAKQGLVELLAQWPDMTINRLLNYESYIDRVARNHYAEGLRKAGVPESSAV